MSENDPSEGTKPETPEAPAATPSTPVVPDEVTTLKSRNAGLDAKVTTLSQAQIAAEARATAAEAKLAQYEQGKLGADEALRAQLVAEQERTKAAEKKAALALVEAHYPEAFAELGEAAFDLTPEKLASLEARLKGVAEGEEAPTPRGADPARRSGSRTPAKAPTISDVEAEANRMFPVWPWKN